VVADMLEGMKFALGPSMAVRRDALEAVGGFVALANYCADDFVLGMKVHAAGFQVVLSHHIIEHIVVHRRFSDSLLHQVRWVKSTRFSRPLGHLGSGLTFAMPFGILGMVAGVAGGQTEFGLALLGWAMFSRIVQALIAGWGIVEDPSSVKFCWLYPVRDLMGFLFWCASFLSPTIVWRGERYRLQPGGTMVLDSGEPVSSKPVQGRLL